MFSPVNQPPSASVRSSRRRQRPLSNEGSIVQPKAKRQRSALSEQTFLPPDGTPEMEETKSHKIATVAKREVSRELTGPRREIAVRGKKSKPGDRGSKGDGSVLLTTNDTYTVSKLPALPDLLRTDVTSRQHGEIDSESGYALTLTHSHAIVWPYAVNVHSPETFTFTLPYPSKQSSDPLPLGTLVSASASSIEPGLVVVTPRGKITYWESIASAATLDLIRQQRNGVELAIPGMLNQELVVNVLNAESAGFVLSFSTGRLAYMSVRDGQGRPAISVQFLRGSNAPIGGGIFGSLRNALGASSLRGDIAAVRAGKPEKVGERNVIVATAKGKIQSWNIHRGGHSSLRAESDAREKIVEGIKEAQPSLRDLLLETFEIIDFTYTPKSITHLNDEEGDGTELLILTSLTSQKVSYYSLIEVVLTQDKIITQRVRPIKSYTTEVSSKATSKPRLYLPNPALVAYIVFDQAVVVLSMARQPDSPDSQLRMENHLFPQVFEDVVDFRGGNVEVVGSGMEEPHGPSNGIEDSKNRRYKSKYPATVLLVRGGGIIRIAATDVGKLSSSRAQQVTAKSKLEQAVFFGTLEKNPLSFKVRPELQFPPEEVGAAALELSLEILKSQTPHIPATLASIDMNLKKRSAALQHLAEYLKVNEIPLDRVTRWKLLWDAEKMEAAAAVWKRYDAGVKLKPEGQKRGLLTDIVESIHEDFKANPVSEAGELDRVRHWFINDIWNIELAIPWAYQALKHSYTSGENDHNYIAQLIGEADDVVVAALEGAFKFRTANLDLYGLQDEHLEHGIIKSNYQGFDNVEIWTSTPFIVDNVRKQTNLAVALLEGYIKESARNNAQIEPRLLDKLRFDIPSLVDLGIRSSTERIRWSSVQSNEELKTEAEHIRALQTPAQDEQITILAENLDLSDDAIAIAEKHQIMPTLATVIMLEINYYSSQMQRAALSREDFESMRSRADLLDDRVKYYFDKFGSSWANALYEHDIERGEMSSLLESYQEYQEFLSAFLRSKPEYAKVAWIHEVTREQNFHQAAETLLDLGLKREQDLWSKKMELSIGKLARMAGRKYSQANGILIPDGGQTELVDTGKQLSLIKIQDRIYEQVLPAIANALDDKAELQLALEAHGNRNLSMQKAFSSLLEEGMGHLVRHESMETLRLIDLLTLMDGNEIPSDQMGFQGEQFYLALQASRYGVFKDDERTVTQRVIWRRCMLRDDWAKVNNTDMKDDQEVNDQLRDTTLYMTFQACLKNGIFDVNPPVKPISPHEVLGVCTEELQEGFDGLDARVRDGILRDMRIEDDAFKPYLDKCRLEKWYQSALDLAKQDFSEELAEKTDDGKKIEGIAKKLESIEQTIAEKERSSSQKALHARGKTFFDGSIGKFRRSTQQRA